MIIYFHGFNSGGNSAKATALRSMFSPVPVLAPTYPSHRVSEAVFFLREYIYEARRRHADEHDLMFVGSSLGALYAQRLAAQFRASIVLINPSVYPEHDLLKCIGENRNHATGETYTLTKAQVCMLASLRIERSDTRIPTLVLLDEGDELLDFRVAKKAFADQGKIVVFSGGSHRFEHLPQAEAEIRAFYESGRG